MSRKIKLDQNNSRKRATINYAVNYASTPKNAFVQFHSISLSEIETASSSSGGRRNLQLQGKELLSTLNYIYFCKFLYCR